MAFKAEGRIKSTGRLESTKRLPGEENIGTSLKAMMRAVCILYLVYFRLELTELILAYVLNCLLERAIIYSMGGARLLNKIPTI